MEGDDEACKEVLQEVVFVNREGNPAGLSALAVMVLVWVLSLLNVDIPTEVAAAAVGLVAGVVSYFNPRESEA